MAKISKRFEELQMRLCNHGGIEEQYVPTEDLLPFLEGVYDSVNGGFIEATEVMKPYYNSTTKANIITNEIHEKVKQTFKYNNSCKFFNSGKRFGLYIKDKYLLFFKKVGDDLLPRNIPTNTAMRIFDNQYKIPGMDKPIPILFIGYITNSFCSHLEDIQLIYLEGENILWNMSIIRYMRYINGLKRHIISLENTENQETEIKISLKRGKNKKRK